jgi:hypothetical protein
VTLIDLVYEVGLSPKKVADTLGGEYHSACPRCGGIDRFIINPNKPMKNCYGGYWCRRCGIHGDSIQFCREFLGLNFNEALARVNATISRSKSPAPKIQSQFKLTTAQLIKPPEPWIRKANSFIEVAHEEVFKYQDVLEWLRKRGIDDLAIKKYKLGWNNCDQYCARSGWGLDTKLGENGNSIQLYLPKGLVIPAIDTCNENIYRIKVRCENCKQDDKFPRYLAIPGSMNGLNLFGNKASPNMICVESELDAIFLGSVVGGLALIVAVGGNIKNPDNLTDFLAKSKKQILICHDNDAAGLNMLKKWQSIYPLVTAFPSPVYKDIGEAVEHGFNVQQWIMEKLSSIIKEGCNM